jgi:hypothetical protein
VLLRTGGVPLTTAADRQVLARHARALGGAGPEHTWGRLFLAMPEAAALSVLLVCDQGWNRPVLDAMTVPDDMPGAGEDGLDIYRVPVLKRRRPASTRDTSVNLAGPGPDTSGRPIRQAIEATGSARLTLAALGAAVQHILDSLDGMLQKAHPWSSRIGQEQEPAHDLTLATQRSATVTGQVLNWPSMVR